MPFIRPILIDTQPPPASGVAKDRFQDRKSFCGRQFAVQGRSLSISSNTLNTQYMTEWDIINQTSDKYHLQLRTQLVITADQSARFIERSPDCHPSTAVISKLRLHAARGSLNCKRWRTRFSSPTYTSQYSSAFAERVAVVRADPRCSHTKPAVDHRMPGRLYTHWRWPRLNFIRSN